MFELNGVTSIDFTLRPTRTSFTENGGFFRSKYSKVDKLILHKEPNSSPQTQCKPIIQKMKGENIVRWIVWIVIVLVLDLKYKAIFNINIVKISIIHVIISFSENHIKNNG